MPHINQLQMQIHQVFSPNFTIKGWLHAKHLAQLYSREQQLRSAYLLLAIDKYLDPQLLLMETIWPVPEKGQSAEARKESSTFSSLPLFAASLPKNLFRSGSWCWDGCWGERERSRLGARVGAARETTLCSPCEGSREDRHYRPLWGEPATLHGSKGSPFARMCGG